MKIILPKKLIADPAKLARALTNGLNATAKGVQVDFNVTTQTWQHKPSFAIDSPTPYQRTISTDDEVYGYVNEGTRAHDIRPKGKGILRFRTPFRAKTLPNTIASSAGSLGANQVVARVVHHPGSKARAFDRTIAKKWDAQMATIMQRAIDSEV